VALEAVFSGFQSFYPQNCDLQGRFQGSSPPPPCFLEFPTALGQQYTTMCEPFFSMLEK